MDQRKTAYLQRAFERLRADAIASLRHERQRAVALGTKQGLGGNTLITVGNAYTRTASETMEGMARRAYDLTGSTEGPVCEFLEQALRILRDDLSNDLAAFFRSQRSWAPANATDAVGNAYLNEVDQRITAIVDDFHHGFLGGDRLTKDPLVSVVTSVTGSPGAVVQSGLGNVQKALTAAGTNDARAALAQFIQSREVQSLRPEDKQTIADIAEVVKVELDKAGPDASKLARWGRRLLDVAQQLGVAVATSGIEHALFGGGTP